MSETLEEIEQAETPAPDGDEPDDDERNDEPDATDTPDEHTDAPDDSLTPEQIEKLQRELDREAKRHTAAVSRIMGDDATMLLPCELCEPNLMGLRWPMVPEGDPREPLYAMIGGEAPSEIPDDDEARRCERCDGHGVTLTHSRVPGSETRACIKCGAKGWTTQDERTAYDAMIGAREAAAQFSVAVPSVPPATATTAAADEWGRPQGTEFFGKNPIYMTPDEHARDWQRTVR